jgi:group I intron endonuclease
LANKKELIKQYKQTIPVMGVYQIRNLVNGKIWVGSSKNLYGIGNRYKFQLNLGSHKNKILQEEYTRYGPDNFIFEIIDYLPVKEDRTYDYTKELKVLEELWLDKLQPYNEKGYNFPMKRVK